MKAGVYRRPEVDPQLGRLISGKQDKEGLQSNYLPFAICLTAAVFFAALFHTFPQIDVQISIWFGTTEGFALSKSVAFSGLRSLMFGLTDGAMYLVLLLLVVGIIAKQCKILSTRFLAFCLTCYAIGPGLIVNGILKRSSGRVRPRDAEMFGGDGLFFPFLDFSGPCESACSFVSGEASAIATVAAILLIAVVPRLHISKRFIARLCIIIIAIGGSSLRVAVGAHYLSDIVFSWIIVFPLVLGLHSAFQMSLKASLVRYRWFQFSSSTANEVKT